MRCPWERNKDPSINCGARGRGAAAAAGSNSKVSGARPASSRFDRSLSLSSKSGQDSSAVRRLGAISAAGTARLSRATPQPGFRREFHPEVLPASSSNLLGPSRCGGICCADGWNAVYCAVFIAQSSRHPRRCFRLDRRSGGRDEKQNCAGHLFHRSQTPQRNPIQRPIGKCRIASEERRGQGGLEKCGCDGVGADAVGG